MDMTMMARLMVTASGFGTVVQSQGQQSTQKAETESFDKLMGRKQEETKVEEKPEAAETDKPVEQKTSEKPEKTDSPEAETEEEITDEQTAIAVGLMMEFRPEIQYVEPEETVEEIAPAVVEEIVEDPVETVEAPMQRQTVEQKPVLHEAKAETPVTFETETPVEEVETAVEAPEKPVETVEEAAPQVRGEAKAQVAPTRHTVEDDGEEPEELPQVELEAPVFQDVKAAPVKVAEPAREAVELEAPDAEVKLSEKLTASVAMGQDKVEITLSPESLGKLTVEISRTENGALSIVLNAESPKTLALLQRHSAGLENLLAAGTKSEVRVEVQQGSEAPKQFLNPNGEGNEKQRGQEQQNHRDQQKEQPDQDFLQRLRLGLVDLGKIAS